MKKISLLILMVFGISFAGDYDRDEWKHWIDLDKDGQDTRQEVLVAENIAPPESTVFEGTKIVKGKWVCMFTGDTITNPKELDIDHLVSLKEAYVSGGDIWFPAQKKVYANFLDSEHHLIAVKSGANRSKGSKDPSEWLPEVNKCWYIVQWVKVKEAWNLSMDDKEKDFITKYLYENCCCCE